MRTPPITPGRYIFLWCCLGWEHRSRSSGGRGLGSWTVLTPNPNPPATATKAQLSPSDWMLGELAKDQGGEKVWVPNFRWAGKLLTSNTPLVNMHLFPKLVFTKQFSKNTLIQNLISKQPKHTTVKSIAKRSVSIWSGSREPTKKPAGWFCTASAGRQPKKLQSGFYNQARGKQTEKHDLLWFLKNHCPCFFCESQSHIPRT